jgi:hypothetical protein
MTNEVAGAVADQIHPAVMQEPSQILHWVTTMTPDKLAIVVPFVVGYVIVRTRSLRNDWIWPVCMSLGAVLFWLLQPPDPARTLVQDVVTRLSIGVVLGFGSALLALGLHSTAFKWLAAKWPALDFLVIADGAQPPAATTPERQTTETKTP